MTLNEALILSYIKRGIGYGYNIMSHVKDVRSDEWVDFSRAGLYKTLDRLEKLGYVKKQIESMGGRPPRKIYTISAEGDTALNTFLDNGFDFGYQEKDEIDSYIVTAAAAFADSRYLAEKIKIRIEKVKEHIERFRSDWPEEKGSYPFIVYALYLKRVENLENELKWLQWLKDNLDNSTKDVLHLTWGEVK